ncbi:TetR/AcrR family transcriptional regulator [Actinospica sp. MGRD01-02]|uniref:TetR/AcrR family transcriptional regulator n=1 Tax=Actinospica acidithermotolerans TaxID=2828514 RepID=A0A941EHJ1_9ACTN|nr:TetR/AcrR family transcriptional regulator [Actinospica acidithermotolerans]MBR7830903.1 TetR/AcrR family transcriptional regulator [Actinospica acidithermotolerans]
MTRTATPGRPRSETARLAVLHAVEDMLVETGYSAMTMKGIAERAGVGRQTVYRWWPTKAHILIEACADDARTVLTVTAHQDPVRTITDFLVALVQFLTTSAAGAAYRALLGEAQHDAEVAGLFDKAELLAGPARAALEHVRRHFPGMPQDRLAAAELCGPIVLIVISGGSPPSFRDLRAHADRLAAAWA